MTRLFASMKLDFQLQCRNKMYAIGIVVGVAIAVGLSQLAAPEMMPSLVPSLMLIVIGGSTLMYAAGMILFERDEGTLNAVIVSPLKTSEYLWSKILTLAGLATIESIVMIGGSMAIMGWSQPVKIPNVPILLTGIVGIGVIYTLVGLILVVRFLVVEEQESLAKPAQRMSVFLPKPTQPK